MLGRTNTGFGTGVPAAFESEVLRAGVEHAPEDSWGLQHQTLSPSLAYRTSE